VDVICVDLWLKDFPLAHNPEGKTLGIVGMGGIGSVSSSIVLKLIGD